MLVYLGPSDSQDFDVYVILDLPEPVVLPAWVVASGYQRANGPRPEGSVPGPHGVYKVNTSGVWYWALTPRVYKLPIYLEYDEAAGTSIVKYVDDWDVIRPLPPTYLGAPKSSEMTTAIASAVAAQAARSISTKVVTDASGNFTLNYASKGYASPPVITLGLEAEAGWTVTMSAPTATSVSGKVTKPKAAVLGLLPYEAAGAGVTVHVRVGPAS